MARLTRIAAAGLAATALGLTVAACQPQEMAATPHGAAAAAVAMTVAEIQELVVGNTAIVRDEGRKVSRAEYFSPDGTVKLKAKPDAFGMSFNYVGEYYFNDQGRFCANYPTLPVSQKEYCEYMVPLGDGRYELSDGSIYERVLDGEQLGELK
jgi:hypothetical protein